MKLEDNDPIPFGKYQGIALANVPDKYLLWLYEQGCRNLLVKAYIEDNLAAIKLGLRNVK